MLPSPKLSPLEPTSCNNIYILRNIRFKSRFCRFLFVWKVQNVDGKSQRTKIMVINLHEDLFFAKHNINFLRLPIICQSYINCLTLILLFSTFQVDCIKTMPLQQLLVGLIRFESKRKVLLKAQRWYELWTPACLVSFKYVQAYWYELLLQLSSINYSSFQFYRFGCQED